MKRKCFLVVLVLILAIFLSGCGMVLPAADEAKIKSVINEFCLALNNQDWSKAKSCCVYGSDAYNSVCDLEELINDALLSCDMITINLIIDIQNVSINGNDATASTYASLLMTACGGYEASEGECDSRLQKVGNSWKIYEYFEFYE
jgi:hypothetical protein